MGSVDNNMEKNQAWILVTTTSLNNMGSYTKKNITSGDLDNQSTHQLEDAQDSRES